jgi:hypothetical protein
MGIVFGGIDLEPENNNCKKEPAVLHKIQFFIKVKNAQHW